MRHAQEKAVAKEERIQGQMDFYLDVSYSMELIEEAAQFVARAFPLCDDPLLIMFNDNAVIVNITNTGNPLQDTRAALRGVRAGGGTLPHKAFDLSIQSGRAPDKIMLFSDGGENRGGRFAQTLKRYMDEQLRDVMVSLVRFEGDPNHLARNMGDAGLQMTQFDFTGDYYLFDQITSILAGAPGRSIVDLILETQLPHRV